MSTKLEELGIDINTTYEIGGCIDSMNTLMHYVFYDLEHILDYLNNQETPSTLYLREVLNRITCLLYIVEDKYKDIDVQQEKFFNKLYSLDKEENISIENTK